MTLSGRLCDVVHLYKYSCVFMIILVEIFVQCMYGIMISHRLCIQDILHVRNINFVKLYAVFYIRGLCKLCYIGTQYTYNSIFMGLETSYRGHVSLLEM